MAIVEKSVLIEHTAAEMFTLVDDVTQYPAFLPWCSSVDLLEKTDTVTAATVHLDFQGIKAEFSTVNDKTFPTLMNMRLRAGMFRNLDGHWAFTPLGDAACKVEFKLSYEFSNKVLEVAVGPVFKRIANTLIDAFVTRAATIRG